MDKRSATVMVVIIAVLSAIVLLSVLAVVKKQNHAWQTTQETNQVCLDLIADDTSTTIASIENAAVRQMIQDQYDALIAKGSDRELFMGKKGERVLDVITSAEFCQSVKDFSDQVKAIRVDAK